MRLDYEAVEARPAVPAPASEAPATLKCFAHPQMNAKGPLLEDFAPANSPPRAAVVKRLTR